MEEARVITIHKRRSFDDLNNYRPTSTLSIFSKSSGAHYQYKNNGVSNAHNIITMEKYEFCKSKYVETAFLGIKKAIVEDI